ncbi:vanadium-dependent haloperoxidase [Glaciecola sp. KUL10]|uniref:vanadium-dependent haloperoxidase n=1 Tax=Glaciecola sp. (strain KUL10) TaxID=2161813 RepID=UPI000D785B49|nr:vanadium-dependent haloperoxidase [Glaciecola sp. KUL10]
MLAINIRKCVIVGLYSLPLVTNTAFAQDQNNRDNAQQASRNQEVSHLSRAQRSGYLGKVSESIILSGNLDVLQSTAELDDFFEDITSLKERVKYWHRVAIDSVALDHTPAPNIDDYSPSQGGPTRTSRALAMTQIAVFDALNSTDPNYQGYTANYEGFEGASAHAAVAYAAYSTLVVLFPQQNNRLGDLLNEEIIRIESFTNQDILEAGLALGELASTGIFNNRVEDGSFHEEPNFGGGGLVADGAMNHYGNPINGGTSDVGEWVPDPNTPDFAGDFNLSLGAYWGNVKPFFLRTGDQFRVPAPPQFNSAEYAKAYANVASVGGSIENTQTLSTSNDETRFVANYWGYDGVPLIGVPPRVYNQIVEQIADDQIDNALEYARVLALVNTGMADAAIAAWDSKYYYNLWRPVTGIRSDDGADATITDVLWNPVGVSVVNTEEAIRATPPFPAYPSGHSTFGAVTFEILRSLFGDNTSFTFVSDEYNGEGVDPFFPNIPRPFVPVRFSSFTEAQEQNGTSRIYNGVHWDFDDSAGQALGEQIGQFLMRDTNAFSVQNAGGRRDNDNGGRDGGRGDNDDGSRDGGRDGGRGDNTAQGA